MFGSKSKQFNTANYTDDNSSAAFSCKKSNHMLWDAAVVASFLLYGVMDITVVKVISIILLLNGIIRIANNNSAYRVCGTMANAKAA